MTFSRTLLRSAAISLLTLTAVPAFTGAPLVPAAEAATNVSVRVFFDALAPMGRWVSYRNDYVFIPANTKRGWRPYTLGHWIYSDELGWVWRSDEPFGWATYHYGRWGYAEEIGWYWIPGTRWAPAWVSWKRSKDYVVWAPLPPARNADDVSVHIAVNSIPDIYWVAVPTASFLDVDLRVRIVDNDRDRLRIVHNAEPRGTVVVRNNIVVNNVIDVKIIEKDTGKKAERARIERINNPRDAEQRNGDNGSIAVFQGEVSRDKQAKPKDVATVDEVKKARKKGGNQDNNATSTTNGGSQDNTAAPAENGTGNGAASTTAPDNGQNQDQSGTNKKKKRKNTSGQDNSGSAASGDNSIGQDNGANTGATTNESQSGAAGTSGKSQKLNKKKSKATENPPPAAGGNTNSSNGIEGQQDQGQSNAPQKKKQGRDKAKATQEQEMNQQGQDNGQENAGKAKNNGEGNGLKKKKNEKCDPAQDANCPQ